MKTRAKIIGGSLWFCFLLWLSFYGSKCFPGLMEFIQTKIIRIELLPDYKSEISFMVWNVVISLLGWMPIFFTRNWRATAFRTIGRDITFMFLLTAFMINGAIEWEMVFQDDFNPTLFVNPSNMSSDGWSPFELWCVWWAFIIVANAISAALAYSIWKPQNRNPLATLA